MTTTMTALHKMQTMIDTWDAADDLRAIFLTCYAMMTRNMLTAIDRREFHDGVWVAALLHHFAEYYFDATAADHAQDGCPAVWSLAFDATRAPKTHVLQNLFLGVNAHINYDLVLTLVDMLQADWHTLSDDQRQQRHADHSHVNDIIAATINSVQDQVVERYSPSMDIVDKLFGPMDEWLIARLIRDWREDVWQHASHMMSIDDDNLRETYRLQVHQQALLRGRAIAGQRGISGLIELVQG